MTALQKINFTCFYMVSIYCNSESYDILTGGHNLSEDSPAPRRLSPYVYASFTLTLFALQNMSILSQEGDSHQENSCIQFPWVNNGHFMNAKKYPSFFQHP